MALGATEEANLKNWDLAVPGSPHNKTLISPLIICLSFIFFGSPPKRASAIAVLMSAFPYIEGAILLIILNNID